MKRIRLRKLRSMPTHVPLDNEGHMLRTIRVVVLILCFFLLLAVQPATASDNDKILSDPSLHRARALYNEGKYEEAFASINEGIRKFPKAGPGYVWRAAAESKLGRHDEAVADIEKGLELSDKATKAGAVETAAWIYDDSAWSHKQKHENDKALSDYARAVELDPGLVLAYWRRSFTFLELGKNQEAIADLDRCLGKLPNDSIEAVSLAMQGRAYLKLGNEAKARANIARLLEIDPRLTIHYSGDHALEFYDLEKRRSKMREEIDAAKQAESAGTLLEAFRLYESARARTLLLAKSDADIDQTAEDVDLAKRADDAMLRLFSKVRTELVFPEDVRRFSVQAEAAVRQKRFDEAIKLFQKGLAIAPWWPAGYYNLALMAETKEQYPEAIANMKHYLALVPNAPDAREAQDKIYEWELGNNAKHELRASTLAGTWSYVYGGKIWVKYTWDLVVVGENQLEMNPIKLNSNMKALQEKFLTREESGYYSLTLKGRQLEGALHQGKRPELPVTAELGQDNNEMTISWTYKGKVTSTVWKREK